MRAIARVVPLVGCVVGLALLQGYESPARGQAQQQQQAQTPSPQPQAQQAMEATKNLNAQLSAVNESVPKMPDEITWGPGPAALPMGVKAAALEGDPAAPGKLYTIRLKMPAGYKIMPHSHPTDEHVTVVSGSFAVGHGDTFDAKELKTLPQGGYVAIPAGHHHFATAKKDSVIQLHGLGPFAITYVNPADDPRNQDRPPTK